MAGARDQNSMIQMSPHDSASVNAAVAQFATTHWTIVLSARDLDSTQSNQALAQLCRSYWYPLYAFVRRQGHTPHDAQDLTQEFFARLLEKKFLGAVNREKGKFRSFLLASLKHFLANEWDKASAQKRGGGQNIVSIDEDSAETRYRVEPSNDVTPEKLFERRWALTLLEKVLAQLRDEFAKAGKENLFEQLKDCLAGARNSIPYSEIATKLGMSEDAVKVSVHRLPQRYRELLRAEIARTVSAPGEVEDGLRSLFAALSG